VNKTPYEQLYHAVQATFLAAVQSQILALSFQDNSTSLKITTNTFGFVGILQQVKALDHPAAAHRCHRTAARHHRGRIIGAINRDFALH
jgi:flagellar biosynthesis regulator FlbT